MTSSMTIFFTVAFRKMYRCVENLSKLSAIWSAIRILHDFSSRIGQYEKKETGSTMKRVIFDRFGLFRKIHILESRLTHRPTTG